MNLKVLIVDDDDIMIFLHKRMVINHKLSSDPLCFRNGKEVFDFLQKDTITNNSNYLILLDINMPVMDGWDLLDALQKNNFSDKLKVIMVTSSINAQDKVHAKNYNQVIDFIEKPLTNEACGEIKKMSQISAFF